MYLVIDKTTWQGSMITDNNILFLVIKTFNESFDQDFPNNFMVGFKLSI